LLRVLLGPPPKHATSKGVLVLVLALVLSLILALLLVFVLVLVLVLVLALVLALALALARVHARALTLVFPLAHALVFALALALLLLLSDIMLIWTTSLLFGPTNQHHKRVDVTVNLQSKFVFAARGAGAPRSCPGKTLR
jgi:hypothetical protein